jgi:16S rRNA processing protein RimM
VPEARILLGVIGRPHGVRGLVHITSHTADPADVTAYGSLTDAKGRRFALRWRAQGVAEVSEWVNGAPVKVADRNGAERLTNTRLYIDRSALPAPDDDEFYLADLVGLAAVDPDGAALGTVSVVHDYGAGASLEIEAEGKPVLILPFTKACVPVVDVAGGRIVAVRPDEVNVAPQATRDAADDEATGDGALGEGALGDGALGEGALGDGASREGAADGRVLGDATANGRILDNATVSNEAMGGRVLGDGALHEGRLASAGQAHGSPPAPHRNRTPPGTLPRDRLSGKFTQ